MALALALFFSVVLISTLFIVAAGYVNHWRPRNGQAVGRS